MKIGTGSVLCTAIVQARVGHLDSLNDQDALDYAARAANSVHFVYPADAEPFISNFGDLTREEIGKLIEIKIDNAY